MAYEYRARIVPDEDGRYVVTFPDLPYGATDGETLEEALFEAQDCLDEVIAGLIADGQELPEQTKAEKGEYMVPLSLEVAAKVALNTCYTASNMSKVEFGRRFGAGEKEVRRLLDPRHSSKIPRMQRALRVFGKQLVLGVEDIDHEENTSNVA